MANKIIKTGKEAIDGLKAGIERVNTMVSPTLGPKGRNAIFTLGGKEEYENSDDGYRLLREIHLTDPIENLAAKAMRDVCTTTNEKVGDGTTTSVVLAHAIFNKGYEKAFAKANLIGQISNPVAIKEQILKEADDILIELKKQTKPIETNEDIKNVAFVSSNSKEVSELVAGIYEKTSKETAILVEEGDQYQTISEIVEGIEIPQGLIARELITKDNAAIFDEKDGAVKVLFTNYIINQPSQLIPMCEKLIKNNIRRVAIFARAFAQPVYPTIKMNTMTGNMRFLAVTFPTTDYAMEDYAIATGGKFYDEIKGMKLEDVQVEDFGEARKIVSYPNDLQNRSYIIGGKGNKFDIAQRLTQLRDELAKEKLPPIKEKLRKRIGALSGGLGIIKVGGGTQGSKTHNLRKIEDTVNSVRIAIEQGIVQGGGLAFKKISETLSADNLLKEPLLAPYQKIQDNAGGNLKIAKNIYDPAGVEEVALKNAVEVATRLLTTETAIANDNPPDFLKILEGYFKDHPIGNSNVA